MKKKKEQRWKEHTSNVKKFLKELNSKKSKKNEEETPIVKPKPTENKVNETIIDMGEVEPENDIATEDMINRYKEEIPEDSSPRLAKIQEENTKSESKKAGVDKSKECYDTAKKTQGYDWETRSLLVDGVDTAQMETLAKEYAKKIGDDKFAENN